MNNIYDKNKYVYVKLRYQRNSEIEKHISEVMKKQTFQSYIESLVRKDMENGKKNK